MSSSEYFEKNEKKSLIAEEAVFHKCFSKEILWKGANDLRSKLRSPGNSRFDQCFYRISLCYGWFCWAFCQFFRQSFLRTSLMVKAAHFFFLLRQTFSHGTNLRRKCHRVWFCKYGMLMFSQWWLYWYEIFLAKVFSTYVLF